MVILLVEDDAQVRHFVWRALEGDGITVLIADHGEAALEVSRNHSGLVHLLLSDVHMPGMSGLELWKILAAERPDTKVLLMSGDLQRREQVVMAAIPFLQKPFTTKILRESITSLLGPIWSD
jgi:two-component system, cell cycle sensor histidine kinase and response regulator CckA